LKKKLLLHICCAPCTIIPLEKLSSEFDITGYFYNPNIHPYKEYQDRLQSVKRLAKERSMPLIIGKYPYQEYLQKAITFKEIKNPQRCRFCYETRLEKTFETALQQNIPLVSSTLLYSKYQHHDLILESIQSLSHHFKELNFFYQDFRPWFYEGLEKARQNALYMQKYCGCLFSNQERYEKHAKRE